MRLRHSYFMTLFSLLRFSFSGLTLFLPMGAPWPVVAL